MKMKMNHESWLRELSWRLPSAFCLRLDCCCGVWKRKEAKLENPIQFFSLSNPHTPSHSLSPRNTHLPLPTPALQNPYKHSRNVTFFKPHRPNHFKNPRQTQTLPLSHTLPRSHLPRAPTSADFPALFTAHPPYASRTASPNARIFLPETTLADDAMDDPSVA